jgi:DnaK suppressor protein
VAKSSSKRTTSSKKKKTTKKRTAATRKASTKSASKAKKATKKSTRKATAKSTPKKSTTKAKSTTKKKTKAKPKATTPRKRTAAKAKTTKATARAATPRRKRSTARKSAATPKVVPAPTPQAPAKPPGGGRLTARDIENFRQMLLDKRAEILGDFNSLQGENSAENRSESAGDLSSMPIHMADLGTDNYELEFTLGLIEGERAILQEIDEALERIAKGTYGKCLATGQPIGKARLRAKPWAKYCYEYTLAQERGQIPRS